MLELNFNWKKLSVIGGITIKSLYFQLHEDSVKAPEVIAFLQHLQQHIPGKLLVIWDGLPAHPSRQVADTWLLRSLRKSPVPATRGSSSPVANGDSNTFNSGTQSGVNAGRDFNGLFNTGTINVGQEAKKMESYKIVPEVEYVTIETVTKEDTKRGETVTAQGFGRRKSSEERYTLPEGASLVEQRAFWNIQGHSTSATTRIEGKQVVANGTIKSHPLDGARVWGELFIAVKYKINQVKDSMKAALDPRELKENLVAWSYDKGALRSATLKVYSADGKQLVDTIQVVRDPLKPDTAQKITAGFIAELGKDTLRISRVGSAQASR